MPRPLEGKEMNAKAMYIFPWQLSFLQPLKKFIEERGDPGNTLVITPNRRPARYLVDLFRRDKKACLLPKMMTISDVVTWWRSALSEQAARMANELDQAGLLYECVKEIAQEDSLLASRFANMDIGTFMPWGSRLAGVLEDFLVERKEIPSLKDLEGEVSAPAAALLGSLGRISAAYQHKLEERGWTTSGLDHKFAADNAANIPFLLAPSPDRPVIIAGFYILSKSHEELLRSLWLNGASICLHTDAALAEGRDCHWACSEHARWIKNWHATPSLVDYEDGRTEKTETFYSFFAGYDLHSQLEKMKAILDSPSPGKMSTAIIPGKNDTLMAILQSLPDRDVNVSMGYPMDRTPLSRLLDDILAMCENAREHNVFRAEDVLKVVRHPYLSMLKSKDENGNPVFLSQSLRALDYEICKTGRYWSLDADVRPTAAMAAECLRRVASFFEYVESLALLAKAIDELCAFLTSDDAEAWSQRYPLDLEVMHRLVHELVPMLRNSVLSGQTLPLHISRGILHQLIVDERIPFEADPMRGLQVLGLLESRLLKFDRIILLDATDDVLPGGPLQDPLLPDALRHILGLPDSARRERASAYNLFRLCSGAKEAHFLWREDVPKSDFYDSKKVRSRFVEKMIWDMEKSKPELLDSSKGPVELPAPVLKILQKEPKILTRAPELTTAIENFWNSPVPVTSLDGYLSCPLSFIWQNIIGLGAKDRSPASVSLSVGNLVHEVLKRVYELLGPDIDKNAIANEKFDSVVLKAFAEVAQNRNVQNKVPVDTWMTLKKTVPARLREFWNNQPEKTRIIALEREFKSQISLGDSNITLKGKPDRVDLRDGAIHIIDYKTGMHEEKYNSNFWDSDDFFNDATSACQSRDPALINECFSKLRQNIKSLQLPAYLLMHENNNLDDARPGNACLIYLTHEGNEQYLFSSTLESAADQRLEHCRIAINLLRMHMLKSSQFTAENTDNCSRCQCASLCGI